MGGHRVVRPETASSTASSSSGERARTTVVSFERFDPARRDEDGHVRGVIPSDEVAEALGIAWVEERAENGGRDAAGRKVIQTPLGN
jgi:hypothetical protein